ncbi:HNH endonuclease [Lactococcus lactis]|uniref:HNH endonuclease n=1 Tax=Lactococcus lactis TaxID=1358 RepID=UPI0013CB1BF8|nr:HNH endonuclease [Lactococcus lactis]MCX7531445.1 HNH endonuclease [Lactococcus lactis]MDM7474874.1 HNH endonuclease [Lactococcus lactis]NEX59348.1 HNH endonuclease [Lactococcus lactis]
MAKAKYEEWILEEGLLKIQGWARDGLTEEQIAHNMGIAVSTLGNWKKSHLEILEALKKGKEVVDIQVENALLKRALGYEFVEVTKERMSSESQKKRHDGQSKLTEKQWATCIDYFDSSCCYCGKSGKLTKDHLQPLKQKGELEIANVVPACASCNSSKKDNQWLSWFQKQEFYTQDKAKLIQKWITFSLSIKELFEEEPSESEMVISKEVTKQVAPDTTAAIFWLKNRKPNEWRDKREIQISGDIGVRNPMQNLTEEELRRLANGIDRT